jgi:hypothetical protein
MFCIGATRTIGGEGKSSDIGRLMRWTLHELALVALSPRCHTELIPSWFRRIFSCVCLKTAVSGRFFGIVSLSLAIDGHATLSVRYSQPSYFCIRTIRNHGLYRFVHTSQRYGQLRSHGGGRGGCWRALPARVLSCFGLFTLPLSEL